MPRNHEHLPGRYPKPSIPGVGTPRELKPKLVEVAAGLHSDVPELDRSESVRFGKSVGHRLSRWDVEPTDALVLTSLTFSQQRAHPLVQLVQPSNHVPGAFVDPSVSGNLGGGRSYVAYLRQEPAFEEEEHPGQKYGGANADERLKRDPLPVPEMLQRERGNDQEGSDYPATDHPRPVDALSCLPWTIPAPAHAE